MRTLPAVPTTWSWMLCVCVRVHVCMCGVGVWCVCMHVLSICMWVIAYFDTYVYRCFFHVVAARVYVCIHACIRTCMHTVCTYTCGVYNTS